MEQARQQMAAYQPDLIIALGGGSSLDTAKVAWFLYERPDINLEDINPFQLFEPARSRLVAVPTTSGTGADVTMGAVLTDTEKQWKLTVYSRQMMPDLTIVDPSLVAGLPPQVTADTGMDVLSHSIEGFTSPWYNDFSDGLCLKATQLVFDYLPRAFANGSDMEAREKMHNAATIAGIGMGNSSIALAHTLAHAFGAIFHIPHGRVVGMFLPYSIEFTVTGGGSRYGEMARFLGLPAADEVEGAASLVKALRDLARQLKQPGSAREMGIEQAALETVLPTLVTNATEDPQILTTLRIPDETELEKIFRCAYEGQTIDF
jgi:alcohol dehydrogenase class IV